MKKHKIPAGEIHRIQCRVCGDSQIAKVSTWLKVSDLEIEIKKLKHDLAKKSRLVERLDGRYRALKGKNAKT